MKYREKGSPLLTFLSVFILTLGLGQLLSTGLGLRAASLVGPSRPAGYGLGLLLVLTGAALLPPTPLTLAWAIPVAPLVFGLLLLTGSLFAPPPHPDGLFDRDNPAHGGCHPVLIPDGDHQMPGLLLAPPPAHDKKRVGWGSSAVCIIPGAGDTKVSFKWRLVRALLAEGLTVLTIDPPGHGDYRHRPMAYPDCLSAIPAAVCFLKAQMGVERVGLLGISLGGALAIASMAGPEAAGPSCPGQVEALVVMETPVGLKLNRGLIYREFWRTISRAPVLSLLREVSVAQIRQSWYTGGYRSVHRNTAELIDLLDPPASLARIKQAPILLVYSRADPIASPAAAQTLHRAAPRADFIEVKKASHVTLSLVPAVDRQVARWLREKLEQV